MHLPSSDKLSRRLQKLQDSFPVALAKRFSESDLMTQAAALTFYALLSLAPLLVLLLWIVASLYPPAQDELLRQIAGLAGPQAGAVARTVLTNAKAQPSVGSLAGLWSTLLLFVGATAVFARLQAALNLIFYTDRTALTGGVWDFLKKRVFSFGVVLGLGFLLIVSMMAATALQVVLASVPSLLPVLGNALTFVLYAAAFGFLYHYLPDRPVEWRQALLGGGDHRRAVHRRALRHRAVPGEHRPGQRLRDDGRDGDHAGVAVLRHGGVLRRCAADRGDRRADGRPGRAPGRRARGGLAPELHRAP
ncbi:membrane protein [Pseudoxanthomonas winnipegensis]|nr:membrane protein [Pseudoxanthomonas winnipegensis]